MSHVVEVNGTCSTLFQWDTDLPVFGDVGIAQLFTLLGITVAFAVAIWSWYNGRMARRTAAHELRPHADRLVILPVYTISLWVVALEQIFHSIFWFVDAPELYLYFMVPFWWSGVEQGFAVLFMQHGAGLASLRRAGIALIFCGLAGQGWAMANYFLEDYQLYWWISSDVWGLCFFLIAWLSPSSWFYRRPSLRGYVAFFSMFYMVKTIANVGEFLEYDASACLFLVQDILREVMRPYFIFRTLLLDSRYWRGLFALEDGDSKPVVSNMSSRSSIGSYGSYGSGGSKSGNSSGTGIGSNGNGSFNSPRGPGHPPGGPYSPSVSLRQPLIGTSLVSSAAQTLAQQVDRLRVPMLNYAYLNLGDAERGIRLLGVGSTARVYRGQYKGKPVAIKLIYVVELTPEVIQNFAREASKLHALRHPNVVRLLGICVRPPSLTLVMEICEYGSLYDVLRASPVPVQPPAGSQSLAMEAFPSAAAENKTNNTPLQRQIPLTDANRLLLAWQCCIGLAHMHSQSPPLLHLDLKSHNFLVAFANDFLSIGDGDRKSTVPAFKATFQVKLADLELSSTTVEAYDDNSRLPETFQWTAPEMLVGTPEAKRRAISTRSDCYALGMVIYEIATLRVPFEGIRRTPEICAEIAAGRRPVLNADIHPGLVEVIHGLWHMDPYARLTAQLAADRLATAIRARPAVEPNS